MIIQSLYDALKFTLYFDIFNLTEFNEDITWYVNNKELESKKESVTTLGCSAIL